MASASPSLLKAIAVTAQIYGREFSADAAQVYAADLADYPEAAVLGALTRCRRELRSFPSVSDILARIDDGRPGAEEAWAMIPKDESASVVWTQEMSEAFGISRHLIESDPVAGRMAFRETYLRLVTDARAARKPTRWEPSLGHDRTTHEPALREAVRKGQLTHEHAAALLPSPIQSSALQLEGPTDFQEFDAKEFITKLRETIEEGSTA